MKILLNIHLLVTCLLMTSATLPAQKVDIDFKINGLENEDLIIAHHYGENTLVDDTLNLDISGAATLTADTLFPQGLYLCIFPDRSYFEFIMPEDQKFSIETDNGSNAQEYIKNMKIKGSDINSAFVEYQLFMIERNKESNELRQALKNDPNNTDIKHQLNALNKEVKAEWESIQKKYPGSFLDKMLNALSEVSVPEGPKDENGNAQDSLFQYNYYKNHFFDHIDFSDNQLLYAPVYHRKLKYYFERVVIRRPDSAIAAADRLLKRLEDKSEYFQYTLAYIFNKYAQTKYMGFDQVMVHLAENYYLNGRAHWVSEEYLDKLQERVEKLKPNLIGNDAPKLDKAQSIEGYFYPLHEVEAKYTVIAFWEPDCGHCKKVIPNLHETVYIELSNVGVQVYAFYTQSDKEEWSKFLEEKGLTDWINVWDPNNFTDFRNKYDIYSTPTLFLLDKDKKIIAKRVDVETIKSIILEKEK